MGTHPIFESDFDCLTGMSGRFDSRSDSRKRGRSRSPEARRDRNERNSRTVTHQKSKNKNDNFKLPHPREPKDKIAQILQGHVPRPVNEVLISKKEEKKKESV